MFSFNGANIFGAGPLWCIAGPVVRDVMVEKPPGVNGEMHLDMGFTGRNFYISGPQGYALLRGASAAVISSMESTIASYIDGRTYVMVDNHGRIFYNCTLQMFREVGRWMYARTTAGVITAINVPFVAQIRQLA